MLVEMIEEIVKPTFMGTVFSIALSGFDWKGQPRTLLVMLGGNGRPT